MNVQYSYYKSIWKTPVWERRKQGSAWHINGLTPYICTLTWEMWRIWLMKYYWHTELFFGKFFIFISVFGIYALYKIGTIIPQLMLELRSWILLWILKQYCVKTWFDSEWDVVGTGPRIICIQRGRKKCTRSLIVNIFGTKCHVVTILARRERVSRYMCSKWPPSAVKQCRCRWTAERTMAVVCLVWWLHMVSRSTFSVAGFKFIPNTGNCSMCWWLGSEPILPSSSYLFTVFVLPVPLQYSLALLKGQPFSHCCCLLLRAPTQHDIRVTRANITLQYRARIVTTCHFVPKILTIKEWVHFFGHLCIKVEGSEWTSKVCTFVL
jgi:hypothetical protein